MLEFTMSPPPTLCRIFSQYHDKISESKRTAKRKGSFSSWFQRVQSVVAEGMVEETHHSNQKGEQSQECRQHVLGFLPISL